MPLKKVSSSKKPTKSSILSNIKKIIKMIIFIIIFAVASKSFINVSKDFTTFLGFLVTALPLSYGYTVGIETPTKVDSKKNVIKLPLSKFKLYIKKLLSVVNPIIFYLGSAMALITAIIFIKTFIGIASENKNFNKENIMDIYNTLIESYKSDITVYKALKDIPFDKINMKNLRELISNIIYLKPKKTNNANEIILNKDSIINASKIATNVLNITGSMLNITSDKNVTNVLNITPANLGIKPGEKATNVLNITVPNLGNIIKPFSTNPFPFDELF